MSNIIKLLIFSAISVTYLFIISKLLGKKQIAQLEFIDYVMGISIGSIASNMATDVGETPFYYYLIGMTIFFLFDCLVSFLGRKGPALKHFFKGQPITIIYEGKLNYPNIKKSKLDINDIIGMCRKAGYFDITDIAYAVFENSGDLSVMPKSCHKVPDASDLNKELPPACLPIYLIVDGRISYSSLNEINKTVNWIYKRINVDKKSIKQVLLATYDDKKDIINVQYKKDN